MKFRILHLY